MNNFEIKILDEDFFIDDYTKYAVFPLKFANMLDEQLDEIEITLKRVPKAYFKPLTPVKVILKNNPKCKYIGPIEVEQRANNSKVTISYNKETSLINEEYIIEMVIASDNAVESPVGSGKYNHQIYLIESTKILEGYIGDSISFTNALDRTPKELIIKASNDIKDNELYKSPSYGEAKIYSWDNLYGEQKDESGLIAYAYRIYVYSYDDFNPNKRIGIDFNALETPNSYSGTFITSITGHKESGIVPFYNDGTIVVEYVKHTIYYNNSMQLVQQYIESWHYTIALVKNRYPLKKWTVRDMIKRIFDTIIPLREGQKSRFRLNETTAEKLEKILAPEMTFTNMTLREMLKQVGGFIHGEPRVTRISVENGVFCYDIDFDFFGSNEKSNISKQKYVTATFKTDINEFCTALDSTAENIVNRLDWASGVLIEPFYGGSKSLRTEAITSRLEENNSTVIETMFPIDTVQKLEYIDNDEKAHDITAFLYEQADYNNLSSFGGIYPYSKSFAMFYSHGAKNIKGMFFKEDAAVMQAFRNYSIVNIITSEAGAFQTPDKGYYPALKFRVTYLPIYSARIRTNKQTIVKGIQRTLAYNQSANQIESRYYGENLKGAIARLGNIEKTYTYNLAFLSDIPKAGTLFVDNYYISSVSVEYLPTYIKCTIGLSKDFNRLSSYVGISSNKRMWEISETQAYQRNTTLNNMIVVSQKPSGDRIFSDKESLLSIKATTADELFNNFPKNLIDLSAIKQNSKISVSGTSVTIVDSYATNSGATLQQLFPGVKAGVTYTVEGTTTQTHKSPASNVMITCLGGTTIYPMYLGNELTHYAKKTVVFTEADLTNGSIIFYGISNSSVGGESASVTWHDLKLVEGDYSNTEIPKEKNPVTLAKITTLDKQSNVIRQDIALTVLSVAMGNSALFSIRFDDNYSAGQKLSWVNGSGAINDTVTGFWGNYVSYSDFYGRFYYLKLSLIRDVNINNSTDEVAQNFPNVKVYSSSQIMNEEVITYRKDSREIPTITVELNAVTDDPNIIIGSALMKNSRLVNNNPKTYEFYVFKKKRINTINSVVDFEDAEKIEQGFTVDKNKIYLPSYDGEHVAWAIVTNTKVTELTVEDEDGDVVTQKIYDGGELVLGGNFKLKENDTTPIYFHLGRDVYY